VREYAYHDNLGVELSSVKMVDDDHHGDEEFVA
jgi:hypothetical protein